MLQSANEVLFHAIGSSLKFGDDGLKTGCFCRSNEPTGKALEFRGAIRKSRSSRPRNTSRLGCGLCIRRTNSFASGRDHLGGLPTQAPGTASIPGRPAMVNDLALALGAPCQKPDIDAVIASGTSLRRRFFGKAIAGLPDSGTYLRSLMAARVRTKRLG